jgi:putative membrane protein
MNLFKGLIAGALAGAAASWVMERFQEQWLLREGNAGETPGNMGALGAEPATMRAADALAEAVTGAPVPAQRRELAGEAMHYATGAGVGGVYGVLAEIAPGPTFSLGAVYGTAVALGVDEALLPALGLAKPARDVRPSEHAYNLASHVVYGLTLEGARRILRVLL